MMIAFQINSRAAARRMALPSESELSELDFLLVVGALCVARPAIEISEMKIGQNTRLVRLKLVYAVSGTPKVLLKVSPVESAMIFAA